MYCLSAKARQVKRAIFISLLLWGPVATACQAKETADKKLSAAVRAEFHQITNGASLKLPEAGSVPRSAGTHEYRYLVTVQSPSDIEGVASDLASLVSKVTRHAESVLSVATKQQLPLLTALVAHQKVRFVEESTERVNEPVVTSFVVPFNYNANLTHNVVALRKLYDLSGDSVTVGLWDEGPVLTSHAEFTGRVEARDPGEPNPHATHVAGTIAAAGVAENQQAGGMAPKVRLLSYDYNNDLNEIESVLGGLAPPQITNHSYTSRRGWSPAGTWLWCGAPAVSETEDYLFGKYSTDSAAIDEIARRHPNTTIFVAAGNQRSETVDPYASAGWDGRHWVPQLHDYSDAKRPSNAQHGGYDTLEGFGLAKNVITVGAMEDVLLGVDTVTAESVHVTNFSSWGPADDGRIKPDLIANGAQLNSPTVQWLVTGFSNNSYQQMSGTSQATPAASGIGALLVELSNKRRQKPLRSDELKAALIHTAVSPFEGPTYQIGWGAIDAKAAGELVAGDSGKLLTASLVDQHPLQFRGKPSGGKIRVTLVWIDPAGKPNAAGINDREPARVMDIKLFLADNRGLTHYPWSLDPSNPTAGAKRTGWNEIDNVQRVDVEGPVSGDWTIEIVGSGLDGQPTIALAISGLILNE